jgi:hypothetical protein
MSDPGEEALLEQEIARLWPKAQERWSRWLLLRDPNCDPEQHSIAQIDLVGRQITLNHREILERKLIGSVESILAHEIGHHVRYPGTMAVDARLRIVERTLLPYPKYSLINLFSDLMINEQLGHTLKDQLAAVYRAYANDRPALEGKKFERDPAFLFYLMIYEELWGLEPQNLLGSHDLSGYPGARAEARLLAQNLFHLGPNLYTQFLYFISVVLRYVNPPDKGEPAAAVTVECRRGDPTADDWAAALRPNAAEEEAIRRALREGWLREEDAERMRGGVDTRAAGLPGRETDDAHQVPEIMAAHYRQEAERHLLRPPRQRLLGEAVVPTTLDAWEPGDPLTNIDWIATFRERGAAFGSAAPLMRAKVAEYEGYDVTLWQPRTEIYLDVSGSMPDPRNSENAMTLAAQILCTSTVRAGGLVRAILYSVGVVEHFEWCRSEIEMSRFLMHYIGGGTEFPFARLKESVKECGREQPIRVVISDSDFDANYSSKADNRGILAEAIERSARFVMLLHAPKAANVREYRERGAMVIEVHELQDFPKMATELARALFPDEGEDYE